MCVVSRIHYSSKYSTKKRSIFINLETGIISISHCRALIARNRNRDTNSRSICRTVRRVSFIYVRHRSNGTVADRHLQILTHRMLRKYEFACICNSYANDFSLSKQDNIRLILQPKIKLRVK